MDFFTSFLIAVAADVACHYIIKWLDGDGKSNKCKRPIVGTSHVREFSCII